MKKFKFILLLLIAPLFSSAQEGYNEVYDKNGFIRPEYQFTYNLWKSRYAEEENSYLAKTKKQFKGENALDPLPRILLGQDYEVLKKGVDQRARAIRAFLKDHYSDEKQYAEHGLISAEVVDRIIARTGEAGYANLVNPESISFLYGPDIIRDSSGNWRVIEDNMGFIGGIGDMNLAQQITLQSYPEIAGELKPRKSMQFYESLAKSYKARAKKKGGIPVLYWDPETTSGFEDERVSEIFESLGIPSVTPKSKARLTTEEDGVYLVEKSKGELISKQKVGFIFVDVEHGVLDPSHPAAQQRNLIDEASEALKDKRLRKSIRLEIAEAFNDVDPVSKIPNLRRLKSAMSEVGRINYASLKRSNQGLLDAVLKSQVEVNYSPGLDFIGDKEFYVYVEELIRFYLNEEPIIHNIETKKFSQGDSPQIDENLIGKVFAELKNYVIKKVDGRGGDSVWVGPKIDPEIIPNLISAIRSNPNLYIAQRFTALSTMNDNIVDLRVVTDVSPNSVTVTDTPWGRGLPKDGNGKVNLSDKGREVTILVVDGPIKARCESIFLRPRMGRN